MSTPTTYTPTPVRHWNQLTCDAIYLTKTPPTIAARALAMVHTAMYDAWTNFNDGGCEVSTTTGSKLKRPDAECTRENREKTYSYAAYNVLMELFWLGLPPENKNMFRDYMCELNYNPDDRSLDPSTAVGIGNLSARLLIECRLGDESNQRATLRAGAYADWSVYVPANPPPPQAMLKIDKWQPQLQPDGRAQTCLTPHWGCVKPFALDWGGEFRPCPPAKIGEDDFEQQAEEVLKISAGLTDEQKIIAEFWACMHEDRFPGAIDKPESGVLAPPPAQIFRMARFISEKNEHKNANDIKLFFALSNALLDAGIAAWDCKEYYDYVRPVSLIRHLYNEQQPEAWSGPCQGTKAINGEEWMPYLVGTPPFAEYVSGHSTFSKAAAYIFKAFCQSNDYGESVTIPAGGSRVEKNCPKGPVPVTDIVLQWATFDEAAEEAGMSRLYGGIHFMDGNLNGRKLGEKVGEKVWNKVLQYFNGDLG